MKRADVERAIDEAFFETMKSRFATIASNEVTAGAAEGIREMHATLLNLKTLREQALAIIPDVFTDDGTS